MKIKVKFFAYFREIFDGRDKDVVLPEGSTVGDLLDDRLRHAEAPGRGV